MSMHLITGRAGEKHVSAADEGALNAAVFGSGQYVLNEGGKMAATVVSNNAVRIADGAAMFHGRYVRLEGYEDLTIESGTQGTYRNDLIVIRYSKDTTANTESTKLVVIKGTASGSTAADPAYVNGNILEGAVQADMPLYRIPLDNVNIGTPVALFEMMEANVGNLDGKQEDTKDLSATTSLADGDYFPFYDVSAKGNRKTLWSNMLAKIKTAIWGTTSGFVKANGSGGISGVSTIPVANGGTGATTAAAARTNLGLSSLATMSTVPIDNGGTNATTRKTAAFNITCIGTNPVTVETDTPARWAELGVGFAYIDELGVVIDQPGQYGFIVSNNYGNVTIQTWTSYGATAATYHRSGNAAGWQSSWIQDYNKYNLNPATLDSNGKVAATQASSAIISISSSTTLGGSHCGKFLNVYSTNGSAITLTIPDSTALPVDTEIEVFRMNSGAVKITCDSNIALRGRGTKTNYGETYAITERYTSAVLKKLSATMWAISGAECES